MDCLQAQLLINARIDNEIGADDRTLLEAHLATCGECRETHEALCAQDAELRRAFQPLRTAADRLADRVIAELPDETKTVAPSAQGRSPRWVSLLLATAVGFLAAVVIFQPWKPPPRLVQQVDPPKSIPSQPVPVARLVFATGAIEVRTDPDKDWQSVTEIAAFTCPSNGAVRTADDVRCELITSDDCVIRMNVGTEVSFHSPSSVELRRGQIWCRSPADVILEVVPAESDTGTAKPTRQKTPSLWSCTTPIPASFLTTIEPDGKAQVTTAGGEVSLKTRDGSRWLKSGETATITEGRVATSRARNQLLASSWMAPLLVSKGHADRDLQQRVDQLLARIGESKLSSLYEHEIRGLGEYCVLPLLRYLQSPKSKPQSFKRSKAMRIVADLAPSWAIGDLIGLLDNADPDVRFLAATALFRLTEQTHRCPPTSWRAASPECKQARTDWLQWWTSNRSRFPMPGAPSGD